MKIFWVVNLACGGNDSSRPISEGTEMDVTLFENKPAARGPNRPEFPKCFRTLVVKIEKTNSNSTRDFSKRMNFTRVDPFVWSTLVVKIKKRRNPLEHIEKHIRRT